jgi:hypothetical protein
MTLLSKISSVQQITPWYYYNMGEYEDSYLSILGMDVMNFYRSDYFNGPSGTTRMNFWKLDRRTKRQFNTAYVFLHSNYEYSEISWHGTLIQFRSSSSGGGGVVTGQKVGPTPPSIFYFITISCIKGVSPTGEEYCSPSISITTESKPTLKVAVSGWNEENQEFDTVTTTVETPMSDAYVSEEAAQAAIDALIASGKGDCTMASLCACKPKDAGQPFWVIENATTRCGPNGTGTCVTTGWTITHLISTSYEGCYSNVWGNGKTNILGGPFTSWKDAGNFLCANSPGWYSPGAGDYTQSVYDNTNKCYVITGYIPGTDPATGASRNVPAITCSCPYYYVIRHATESYGWYTEDGPYIDFTDALSVGMTSQSDSGSRRAIGVYNNICDANKAVEAEQERFMSVSGGNIHNQQDTIAFCNSFDARKAVGGSVHQYWVD